MARSYKIISVDSVNQSMVVEFINSATGLDVTYNVKVPADGMTVEQQVMNVWPVPADLSAGVAAAQAALEGGVITADPLVAAKAAQIVLVTAAAQAHATFASYNSDALGGVSRHAYGTYLPRQDEVAAALADSLRVPLDWIAATPYRIGDSVLVGGGTLRLLCTAAGTSDSSEPTGGGTDGTVTWAAPWTSNINVTYWPDANTLASQEVPHTAAQVQQVAYDLASYLSRVEIAKQMAITAINAATILGDIEGVTFNNPTNVLGYTEGVVLSPNQ